MKDRDSFVKALRADPRYRAALGQARNASERKLVSGLVEELVGAIGEIMGPALERAEKDPAFAARLARALAEGKDVLSNSEPAMSGSNG